MAIMANAFYFLYLNELSLVISALISNVVKADGIVITVLVIFLYVPYIIYFGITFFKWVPFLFMFLLINNIYLVAIKNLTLSSYPNAGFNPTHTSFLEKVQTYNALRMLMEMQNQFLSFVIISQKFLIILICSSGLAICITVKRAPYWNLFLTVFCCLLLLILITEFSLAAKIYENSAKFLQTLKAHSKMADRLKRKTVRMKLGALRPLRIEAGGQYFIDAGVILKIIDAVAQTTVNIILLLR